MFYITPLKKNKALFSGLLAFVLVFSMSLSIFATPSEAVSKAELDALKQQQAQLTEKQAGIQSKYNESSGKVASQTEKLNLLTEQLDLTNAEIENLTKQIAIYTNSIAEMENELNIAREKEQELMERFQSRMRTMEENGSYTYIAMLLGATSFLDLVSRIDCVAEIMTYDNQLVKDVQEAQANLKKAKTDMEEELKAQEIVFAEYQKKQTELLSQQEEVKVVLSSLVADSAEYGNQLKSVNALKSSLGSQISNMESQLKELERIKAEQAASQSSSGGSGSSSSGNSGNWYGDSAGTATGQDIVAYAKGFLGVPYVYGGTSPSGFDCSGLVYYCYRHYGYSVNRTAAGLAYSGKAVSSSELQPGDVILFTSQDGSYIGHTGIYVGGGQFIHAPHTGDVVKISNLSDSYYTRHYCGARRIV